MKYKISAKITNFASSVFFYLKAFHLRSTTTLQRKTVAL